MSRSIVVSRTSLGLDDLQLSESGRLYLPDGTFSTGETGQTRVTSESPQVKGRYPSSIVEGSRSGNISVHVISDLDNLQDDVQEVIDAMTQFRYMLVWQFDGLGGTWQCEKADWALGEAGVLDVKFLQLNTQIVHFVVPHNRVSGF
jgi:hypothetical protein